MDDVLEKDDGDLSVGAQSVVGSMSMGMGRRGEIISMNQVERDFGNMGAMLNITQGTFTKINCVLAVIILHYAVSSLGKKIGVPNWG